jgi:predicted dehydrogenase
MVALAENHKIKTSMGFGGRVGIPTTYINDLLLSGEMGTLLSCETHIFRGYGFYGQERLKSEDGTGVHHGAIVHPEVSGGWTVHHATHGIFRLMLLGGEVEEVYAKNFKSTPEVPSEELVWAMLSFKNGGAGIISDCVGSFRGHRETIIGSKATLTLIEEKDRKPETPIEVRIRREGQDYDEKKIFHYDPQSQDLIGEFLDCIKNDKPSPVSFAQARENLRVCLAARESASTGKIVRLSS